MSRRPHRVGNSRNSRRTTPPHPYTLGNERVLIRPVDGTTRSRHTYGDAYVCRYRVLDSNRARVFVTNVHEIVISRCRSRRPNYKYSLEIQPVAQTDGLVTQFREYCKLYMCVCIDAPARVRVIMYETKYASRRHTNTTGAPPIFIFYRRYAPN